MMTKNYYFLEIHSSPWPIMSTLSSMNLLSSLIFLFQFKSMIFFLMFSLTLMISLMWWKDYSENTNTSDDLTILWNQSVKMGMILFIVSEIMIFFSMFWSYFNTFLSNSVEFGAFPPSNLKIFSYATMPMVNTLILLMSSATLTLSHYYMISYDNFMSKTMIMKTMVLGSVFLSLQYSEYNCSYFTISDSSYGSSFFMLTGLHGFHVLIGILFILFSFMSSLSSMQSPENFVTFELSSWYWHFVDTVWIYVFYFLYFLC